MSNRFIDITGQIFGRLTAVMYSSPKWICRCSCGNSVRVLSGNLRNGTKSCGCIREIDPNRFNGSVSNPTITYNSWKAMINRCDRVTHCKYSRYGGRGITYHPSWKLFDNFIRDMGNRPGREYTLDRYPDPDGNYAPDNCRWATKLEQMRNRECNHYVTLDGETKCMTDWASFYGIKLTTIYDRVARGWTVQRAIMQPVRKVSVA